MIQIARNALRSIVTRIIWLRAAGYAASSTVILRLHRQHDHILRRWPDAYSEE